MPRPNPTPPAPVDGATEAATTVATGEGGCEGGAAAVGPAEIVGVTPDAGGAEAAPPVVDGPVDAAYSPYATTTQTTIAAAITSAREAFRDGPRLTPARAGRPETARRRRPGESRRASQNGPLQRSLRPAARRSRGMSHRRKAAAAKVVANALDERLRQAVAACLARRRDTGDHGRQRRRAALCRAREAEGSGIGRQRTELRVGRGGRHRASPWRRSRTLQSRRVRRASFRGASAPAQASGMPGVAETGSRARRRLRRERG